MKQEAEKIYNIEHADNVNIHIDGLFESAEKFNQAVSRIPGLIYSSADFFYLHLNC